MHLIYKHISNNNMYYNIIILVYGYRMHECKYNKCIYYNHYNHYNHYNKCYKIINKINAINNINLMLIIK